MTHSQVRNPVEVLAEEFVERFRRGERPSLTEYTEKHPDLADEIRELFPLLVEMEEVRSFDDATSLENVPVTNPPELKQLGDYRMIREVGRGGMGIVYEAEQVSLGRHVALKVLPKELLETPQRRSRFEREAKAAAKLHHTNIVPVFGVGENEGQVYYVMQFIQGLALDEVLEELKRLKAKSGSPSRRLDAGESPECHRNATAADAAQSLMTGTFQPLPADAGSGTGEKGGADENLAVQPGTSLPPKAATQASTTTGRTSNTFSISESSVVLPGSVSSQSQRPQKKTDLLGEHCPNRRASCRSTGLRARSGCAASRHQAGQPVTRPARHGVDHRFRPGQAGRRWWLDANRRHPGNAPVHGPRDVQREGRRVQRSVQSRLDAVRAVSVTAGVSADEPQHPDRPGDERGSRVAG
jgi:hypothetical protein